MEQPVIGLVAIVSLAVSATWAAARIRVPSIVLLLAAGVLVGPALGLLSPDDLAGDLLLPVVSISVGLILFEGGLSLHIRELESDQRVIWLLVSAGVLVTWVLGSVAAVSFLDMPFGVAILLGAILVVSGPTVIAPILTSVRPKRSVSAILKWESIVIDPIGAMLAVIAFELILLGADGSRDIIGEAAIFVLGGIAVGVGVSYPLRRALIAHLIPERLIPLVALMAALLAFGLSDLLAPESGLLATSVLGLIIGNDHKVRTETIVQFSEILQALLVGSLFIVLSARLTTDQLSSISWGVLGLVAVLVLVARPLAVAVSTFRSRLTRNEKIFLSGVAPRGIVAAAVASVFALELEEAGVEGAELLTPVTFAVIVATVMIYGLGAGNLARRLGLAQETNNGVLIVGAGPVERAVGEALSRVEVQVVFATTNRADEAAARLAGYPTYYGNLIESEIPWELDLSGLGHLAALTPNDEVNTLACRRFREVFGTAECYQLPAAPPDPGITGTVADIGGRVLFDAALSYDELEDRLERGDTIRSTGISETYTVGDLRGEMGPRGHMLFVVRSDLLLPATTDRDVADRVQPGDTVVWLQEFSDVPA